jgi:ankyrin repeat protein
LELAQAEEIRSILQKKREAKAAAVKRQKEEGKTRVFSEQKTKEHVNLINDYLKDSDSEAVIELFLGGANPNAENHKGFMVLHWVVWYGNFDLLNVLIEMKADMNADMNADMKADMNADRKAHMKADMKADMNDGNEKGLNLLHWTTFSGNFDFVMALIKAGAEVNRIE